VQVMAETRGLGRNNVLKRAGRDASKNLQQKRERGQEDGRE